MVQLMKILIFFIIIFTLCNPLPAFVLQMTADVNRNGIIEPDKDDRDEDAWSFQRGAVFLNNNDSDGNNHQPDYADSIVNGAEDIKDFAEIQIQQMPDISPAAVLTIFTDAASKDKINIFFKTGENQYSLLNLSQSGNINSQLLKDDDIRLFIEGKAYASPAWNGLVDITAIIQDGELKSSDTVRMKVAPFLLLSQEQQGRVVYVREILNSGTSIYTENFVRDLKPLVATAGAEIHIIPDDNESPYYPYNQIWLQDTMEIGHSAMPGRGMNVILKGNRNKALDNYAKDYLLSPDYGWFTCGTYRAAYASGTSGNTWLDWYGNLEVTPPLPGYPFGRVIYGYNPGAANPDEACMNPEIIGMLNAQQVQSPALRIDVGWLTIKHVDEVFTFVPTGKPESPHKVLIHDTKLMINLVQGWKDQGYGSSAFLTPYKSVTVNSFLNNTSLRNYNTNLQTNRIEPIVALIKSEFKLKDSDFIRIPSYFESGNSYVPNMINSLILNGNLIIAKPYGLVIGGKDQLEEYVKTALAELPVSVHFIDNYRYHIWSGEVHCATNVKRDGINNLWQIDEIPAPPMIWLFY